LKNFLTSVISLDVGGSSVKSGTVTSGGSVNSIHHTPINNLNIPVFNENLQNAALLGAAKLFFGDHSAFLERN
jgi:hypothetical protein